MYDILFPDIIEAMKENPEQGELYPEIAEKAEEEKTKKPKATRSLRELIKKLEIRKKLDAPKERKKRWEELKIPE